MSRAMMAVVVVMVLGASNGAFADGLPAGYTQLPFIKASGQCRVKTGITPDGTDKAELTFELATVSGNQNLWCSRSASTGQFTTFMIGNKVRFDRNATQTTTSAALQAGKKYTITANYATGAGMVTAAGSDVIEASVSMGTDAYTPASELCLFASHNTDVATGLGNWGSWTFYSFKLSDANNALRCDLVPAKRNSDGVFGLYDTVRSTFLTSDQSGELALGAGYSFDENEALLVDVAFSSSSSDRGMISLCGADPVASGVLTTNYNTTVTLRAVPAEGLALLRWTGDTAAIVGGSATSAEISVTTTHPVSLTAVFGAPGGVLDEDKNYVGVGANTFESDAIVDLNGHRLYIDLSALDGVYFVDSSSGEPGELHVSVAEGEDVSVDTLNASGNLKLVKEGAGSLGLRPQGTAVECAQGRLEITGRRPIHRWSFTEGSLEDSIGGSTATMAGNAAPTFADNTITFPGGGNGACYLNMGVDVIPSSGDVTIELWGRRNAATHQWASMFSIGVNGNNNNSLRMAWSNHVAGDGKTDLVYLKKVGKGDIFFVSNSMTPYTVGTMYHISMRIVQNADGSAVFTWAKRNVATGAVEKTYTTTVTSDKGWSLAEYKGNPFVLNHGYDNDDEAATYDEVRIWNCALSDEELDANAKAGPDAFPAPEVVDAPEMIHRWSFTDGSLADSVGESTAVKVGSGEATFADGAVTLPGGGNGTCYLNMGADVLPSSGDVTIEIWGTQNEVKDWSRIFAIGTAANDFLTMAWSNAGNVNSDFVQLKNSGTDYIWSNGSMAPYTVGEKYHISMRIVPQTDGKSNVLWAKRDAATGEILKSGSAMTKDVWSLAKYAGRSLWIGHGFENSDAAATYDEVRIWRGALTDDQLAMNAKLGPDKAVSYPRHGKCGVLEIAAGATLATPSDGVACTRLSGAGTLEALSVLQVEEALDIAGDAAGTFTVDGTLKVTGDWLLSCESAKRSDRIVGTGTLDLTETNLEPRYAKNAAGPHLMAEGVSIVGHDQMTVSKRYLIEFVDGRLYIKRPGFTLFVK